MDNIINFDPKEKETEKRKIELLEVLDVIRQQVESGEIREIVATSMTYDGETQIHVCSLDLTGAIGLYEMGKFLLLDREL